MRRIGAIALFGLFVGIGLFAAQLGVSRLEAPTPDAASLITQVREVARLETLDVAVYKKLTFAPEPEVTGRFWSDVIAWARHALRAPRGKAIVFAEAHLSLELERLDADSVWIEGRDVYMSLPPVRVTVELKPGETEIIDSTLDSAQTAKLFELARTAFVREVEADERLKARARASAERAIRGLLRGLGFAEVHFVDRVAGPA